MAKDLTLLNHDAELTLSDGTPVRLALPGPARRRSRPWLSLLLLAVLTGYGVWFAQQPWLFVNGPTLVSQSAPAGLEKVLCQRLVNQWESQPSAASPWLPALDLDQQKPRCLNQPLHLENWVAQGLAFVGAPMATLRLEAIETAGGWSLRAQQQGPALDQTLNPTEPLALVEPLNELGLSALDPILAAQSRLKREDYAGALALLEGQFSVAANLTRARTLRLQGDLDTAWKLYEQHITGRFGGLARAGLAEIAALKGDRESALTLLQDPAVPRPLVAELALAVNNLALAQETLSWVTAEARPSLQAQIEAARGRPVGVINALADLELDQRTAKDNRMLIEALIERSQFADAQNLVSRLEGPSADYFDAVITFEQGRVSLARAELDRLGADAEPLRTLNFLDDGRVDRALSSQDPVLQQIAQAQQALDSGDWEAAQIIHAQLAKTHADWANYLAARINIAAGHGAAARKAIEALPAAWLRERRRLSARLEPEGNWGLTAGEQRLFDLAERQVSAALEQRPNLAAQRARNYLNLRDDARMKPLLADALSAAGQAGKALEVYLSLGSQLSLAQRERAVALAANEARTDAVVELAAEHSRELSTEARNHLLEAWLAQEAYAEAEGLIRQVAVDSPRSATLFIRWGEVLQASGDLTGAASKFGRAARLDDTRGGAYLRWALLEQAQGREAQARMNEAITRELTAEEWQQAADYFEARNDVESAIVALDRAVQGNNSAEARLKLARLQATQGLHKSATENFTRVMGPDIDDPSLWRSWGDALAALGETEAALDKYKRAVRLARN